MYRTIKNTEVVVRKIIVYSVMYILYYVYIIYILYFHVIVS